MIFLSFLCIVLGLIFRKVSLLFQIILPVVTLVLLIRKCNFKKMVICIGIFGLGLGLSYLNFADTNKENVTIEGIVIESKENYFLFQSGIYKYYVYEEKTDVNEGDILKLEGAVDKLQFNHIESQFDFASYLNDKGVFNSFQIKEKYVIFENFLHQKDKIELFLSHFDENGQLVLNALLFNVRDYDSVLNKNFEQLSLIHLFAISGIYIHLFMNVLNYFFTMFIKPKYSEVLSILITFILSLFVFPNFSFMRIVLIKTISYLNHQFLKDKFSRSDVLAMSAFVFILIDYRFVYQNGFKYGYLASYFINFLSIKLRGTSGIKKRFLIVFLLSFLFLPFQIASSGKVNVFFLFIQLLITPLASIIFSSGAIFFLTYPFFPSLINIFSYFFINLINSLSNFTFSINFAPFSDLALMTYYAIFFLLIYASEIKHHRLFKMSCIIVVAFNCLRALPVENLLFSSVHFINVGQGDSTLIIHRGKSVLIDTGGIYNVDVANDSLIPYFRKQKLYNLDYLIITHDDFDHDGAKEDLIDNFPVGKVIEDYNYFPLNVNGLIIENFNESNLDRGENDASFVLKFILSNVKFLLMGDASSEIENMLLNEGYDVDCDILKVGHHGSKSSSSYEFLKATSPDEVIISAGKNNRYGHPSLDTLSRLESLNIPYKITYEEGTIKYTFI